MRILITGGLGYIGSTLATYLVENTKHNVTLIDKVSPSIPFMRYIWDNSSRLRLGNFDLCNSDMLAEQIKNHDTVIHLAGLTLDQCKNDPQLGYFTNYFLSCTIGLLCNMYNKKMIFSSTCSNYGISSQPVDESSELNPTSDYSKSKVSAEKFLLRNTDNLTILRLSTVFGIGVNYTRYDTLVNTMVLSANIEHTIELYQPKAVRPVIHIHDAVKAITFLLESKTRVLNIGFDDLNLTKKAIAEQIKKQTNCDIVLDNQKDDRSYKVSFEKFNNIYKQDYHDLDYGIKEMSKIPVVA